MNKITIIGAGNGGKALAVDLARQNNDIMLYESPMFKQNIAKIKETGTIDGTGFYEGTYKVHTTTSAEEALKHSNLVFVSTPSFAHKQIAQQLNEYVTDNHKIILMTGNMGSIEMKQILKKGLIGETNTLPYGCRVKGPNEPVQIGILTPDLKLSAFPAKRTGELLEEMVKFFPGTKKGTNLLEVALDNPNPLFHPSGVLLHAGQIERTGKFALYDEGITEAVLNMIWQKDTERQAIGKSYLLNVTPGLNFTGITLDGKKLHFLECGKQAKIKGPNSLNDRYLTEDVPYGLGLQSSFAKLARIPTPMMDAEITITNAIHNKDFFKQGRNTTTLDMNYMCEEMILIYLKEGTV